MKKVYVVMAVSGRYEDYQERPIAAYLERALAEEHARKAGQWWVDLETRIDSIGLELSDVLYTESTWRFNPWDGASTYEVPDYRIVEIPLRRSVRPVNKQKAGR